MTEPEIKQWMQLLPGSAPLNPDLVEGMKDVPYPTTDKEEMAAFRAYLKTGVSILNLFK